MASSPISCCRKAINWLRYNAFESAEQAAASNERARDFVAEKLAPLLPNAPTIVQGPMDTRHFARLDDMMADEVTSLYASLRLYAEVDLTQRAHSTGARQQYLPAATTGDRGILGLHPPARWRQPIGCDEHL